MSSPRKFSTLALWAAAGLSCVSAVANEAAMLITCNSLSIPPATTTQFGASFRLAFTNPDADEINNEWFADGTDQITSYLVLDTPQLQLATNCSLNIPNANDANFNTLADFFEVNQAVESTTTRGEFFFDNGMDVYPGTLDATWQREANSATGTCQLRLNVPDLALVNLRFNHTFEVLQYRGTYTYTVSGTNVTGTVKVKREGGEAEFTGPWNLRRRNSAELGWAVTTWTGPAATPYNVLDSEALQDAPVALVRAGARTSDLYHGTFIFDDGYPSTPFPDEYDFWDVLITDPNDADQDEIPDLSDDPGSVVTGPAPILSARMINGNLKLTIVGKTGQAVTLEQSTTLRNATWTRGQTFTLTSDTQEFDLGAPASPVFFIRGRL